MQVGNGEVTVPPGFRFHPTDEELLYYYLRKKVSYQPIDLDVIREVDLNRLEPWDLREKCRIGTGPQNDWYFFSHKDRKYPTGTRTNRATAAGFWKATGRDKAICLTAGKRIGMRKTLVFYIGRAPHGHKTDWIMHEYRLDDDDSAHLHQEDGWVVCRVFKKKNQTTGYQPPVDVQEEEHTINHLMPIAKQSFQEQSFYSYPSLEGLPHLSSPDSTFLSPMSLNIGPNLTQQDSNHQKLTGDWLFLDKLLTNYQTLEHQSQQVPLQINLLDMDSSTNHKFPFQYLGSQP